MAEVTSSIGNVTDQCHANHPYHGMRNQPNNTHGILSTTKLSTSVWFITKVQDTNRAFVLTKWASAIRMQACGSFA